MNAVEAAANGVVDAQTVFELDRAGSVVSAAYRGRGVARGELAGGCSERVVERDSDVRLRLVEHFQRESREGGGTNVFREL